MPKTKKKTPLTRLEKAEIRANNIIANEKKLKDAEKKKQFEQCVEVKLLKGHSQELAEKMAREIIYHCEV
tara:strand:+ start:472 stop:681 length:210 start_codon:yes stop_codon:yes gene_type:complete